MTDLQFLKAEKRALERLNPRVLAFGSAYTAGMVCAGGAYAVATQEKGRSKPGERMRILASGWYDMTNFKKANLPPVAFRITRVNDGVAGESPAERWLRVYHWVCEYISALESMEP